MSDSNNQGYFDAVTAEARLIHTYVFERDPGPPQARGKQDPKFKVTMLLDPADVENLKEAAVNAARAEWPGRKLSEVKFPFASGDKLAKDGKGEFYAGKVRLIAKTDRQPRVFDANNQPIIDTAKVYSGVYGHVSVSFKAYPGNGSNIPDSVTCYFDMVMVTRDGDRIGGRDPGTVFAGVRGKATTDDVLDAPDADDEISF